MSTGTCKNKTNPEPSPTRVFSLGGHCLGGHLVVKPTDEPSNQLKVPSRALSLRPIQKGFPLASPITR